MTDYPWWEEVAADAPLMQGDVVENCPVSVFGPDLGLNEADDLATLLDRLQKRVGIEFLRVIVMTQACDLEQRKVRNAILCPATLIEEFHKDWTEEFIKRKGHTPRPGDWESYLSGMKAGRIWNLTLLQKREAGDGVKLTTTTTVVDFHEVFSLPVDFLELWLRKGGEPRLRLLPPYREHLSQAFARFFMRVGLPIDIKL